MKLFDCFTPNTFNELHDNNILSEETFLTIDWRKANEVDYKKELAKKLNIKEFNMSEKAVVECLNQSKLTKVFFNDKI